MEHIWNISEDEKRPRKTIKQVLLSQRKCSSFSLILTRHFNVEKREDWAYVCLCYEDYWRFSSVKAFPWTKV